MTNIIKNTASLPLCFLLAASAAADNQAEVLIMGISDPGYDEKEELATVKLSRLWWRGKKVMNFEGERIRVTFDRRAKSLEHECPIIDFEVDDVTYKVGALNWSVTLFIENVGLAEAKIIDEAKCLEIPTSKVQELIESYRRDKAQNNPAPENNAG